VAKRQTRVTWTHLLRLQSEGSNPSWVNLF
jgi:hypothetical protein